MKPAVLSVMTPERLAVIKRTLNRRQPDLTVLMENVIKPHNLAAVGRTLEAVGGLEIHAVSNLRSIRLSQMAAGGTRRWMNVRKYATIDEAVDRLQSRQRQVVATTLNPSSKDYRDIDYTRPTAILVGEELEGISEKAIQLADEHISIPIVGMVQSLNVSVAAALVLYEAYRQREAAGMYERRSLDNATYMVRLFEACHPEIAKYCRNKGIPYPAIDEDAELLEPLVDSKSRPGSDYAVWLRKVNT